MKIKELFGDLNAQVMLDMLEPCDGMHPADVLAYLALASVYTLKLAHPDDRRQAFLNYGKMIEAGLICDDSEPRDDEKEAVYSVS